MNSLQKMISDTSSNNTSVTEKICPLCGKKFISKGRQKYCDGPHFKPCPVCGKPVPAPYPSDPPKCCSLECRKKFKDQVALKGAPSNSSAADPPPVEASILPKEEHAVDPGLEISNKPLTPLDKGNKAFFTKECKFESKLKGLIKGHIYDIEVTKETYTYEVLITYDHNYREDLDLAFNIASAKSFNNYFK